MEPEHGRTSGPGRWASVLGIAVAIVVVTLFVVLHLAGVFGSGSH